MKIALLTDAWTPQISGVVTTLTKMVEGLEGRGHEVLIVHPGLFNTVPLPTYPQMRIAVLPGRKLARMVDDFAPDAIHIPVEGPIGIAGRNYCVKRGLPFNTTITTKFPEYIHLRCPLIAEDWVYRGMRWFHDAAVRTNIATQSLKEELEARGFRNLVFWERGVDTELFRPREKEAIDAPRPVSLYLGRVAVEKNIEDYLRLDLPGTKAVIGDGPALEMLRKKYPDVLFLGRKTGEDLARHVAAADLFVFPSRTDTFGIVMIEAMASGLPVAAYPVVGPKDVVRHGETGWLSEDLQEAARKALEMDPARCREHALGYSWKNSLDQFEANLVPIERETLRRSA